MMVFLPKSIDFNTVSVGVGMGTPATTRAVYVSKATLRGLFVGTEMGGRYRDDRRRDEAYRRYHRRRRQAGRARVHESSRQQSMKQEKGKVMATMETVNPKVLGEVAAAALGSGAKRATKYLSEKLTVKATLQGKPLHRDRQRTIVLTVGAPNYDERVYIKRCKAAGEPFPIKKIQLKMLKEAANNL